MKSTRNKYLILNYIFLFCIVVLFLNDHVFKYAYANWLTGKLSDITGIIILPLLLSYFFPGLRYFSILISGMLFAFWKSGFSQSCLDLYNEFSPIQTSRIIDYSDLFVLIFLFIPYFIIKKIEKLNNIKINLKSPALFLIPTFFVLVATSPPPDHYFTRSDGNLKCYRCSTTVDYTQDEIVEKLSNAGIVFDSVIPLDTSEVYLYPRLKKLNINFYKLNMLIIDEDTLRNIDFSMVPIKKGKTRIYFNGMQV